MIKSSSLFLFFSLVLCVTSIVAQDNEDELVFLSQFLVGHYETIGRNPDDTGTYQGMVKIRIHNNQLEMLRLIDSVEVRAELSIVSATADKVKVLRARFTQDNSGREATYLISSDLDNYPRLSGFVYYLDRKTTKPGLESLFIVPNRN